MFYRCWIKKYYFLFGNIKIITTFVMSDDNNGNGISCEVSYFCFKLKLYSCVFIALTVLFTGILYKCVIGIN